MSGRPRRPGRVWPPATLADPSLADPSLAELLALLPTGPLWLGGGEPTLRPDLPALVQAAARPGLGLRTDGLALVDVELPRRLRAWGLRRVRIPLHAARPEAHDWLVDQPGAARRVTRALRACLAAGLEVQVEAAVTRPTMDLLPETVAAAAALGAIEVHLRLPCPAPDERVTIYPRLGLAEPLLERAARAARTAGVGLWIHGFPACALGSARDRLAPPEPVLHPRGLRPSPVDLAPGCPACPGLGGCPGLPAAYADLFGRAELDDRCSRPGADQLLDPGTGDGPPGTPPPPRAGRAPATRLSFAVAQAARGDLAGDPLRGVPGLVIPPALTIAFAPDAPTRGLRQELCRLAQVGSPVLRIDDAHSLRHPEVGALLRECVRLGFQRVEIAGPVQALASLTDRDLVALKGLSRVEAWVRGPDRAAHDAVEGEGSWATTQEILARMARLSKAEVGIRVVEHAAE